ncbi:MAG TPA: HD domain-containing phosphohydrolase [Pyrinomonadaceae bacterium]|jgi:HD-GYP domain-containing protein (c-di-GMP phosphodiesterase class II)
MQEELTMMDASAAATVRLLNQSWASYLQKTCARLKSIGQAQQTNGTHALVSRLKRTRPSTYEHSVRVARLARVTGRAFNFSDSRLQQLSSTAMLHDIGKILVPEAVLNRPRRPTRMEQFVLHLHPSLGALLASYFNLSPELRIRTQHHHERWDGKGYPHRLGGQDIPLMARIVQVVDTYDAMVAKRPYSTPRTHNEAIAELVAHGGKQFDPRVIEAFLDMHPAEGDEDDF